MPKSADIRAPVYEVDGKKVSALDLLRRFADPKYRAGDIWQLSDLHLKVGEPARFRFKEELTALAGGVPLTEDVVEALLAPLLEPERLEQLRATPPTDVDAGYRLPEEDLSFRINAFRDRDGLAGVIRVLPRRVPSVERIGFPEDDTWRAIVEARQGLVLVTGVTGSGKSTTVASLIEHITRHRSVRVITLEDPVEYILDSSRGLISQREVGRHVTSFENGLRSALREDPDVLFVGEMRDRETASLAVTAAETGHLVLSTMHTRDARGAITRLVDMFPADRVREISTQLSFSVSHVLAQKLVPRADGAGRRVAMEVLRNLPPIANLIRQGEWHRIYPTMESHRRQGCITLEAHLRELVRSGQVEGAAARRYANDPTQME